MGREEGMKKPIFDYMIFNDGSRDTEFVAHAKFMTKEEVISTFISELKYSIDFESMRKPTFEDIKEATVRYYPRVPDFCGCDSESGGCYTYCKEGERGSFPVWVIEFEELEVEEMS